MLSKCLLQHRNSLKALDLDTRLFIPFEYEDSRRSMVEHGKAEYQEHRYGGYARIGGGTRRGRGCLSRRYANYLELDRSCSGEKEGGLPLYAVNLPDMVDYEPGSLGSMRHFAKLAHLSIRIGNLLGYNDTSKSEVSILTLKHRLVDLLPPNLENLKLYGYEKGKLAEVDSHVDEFLAQKGEKLQNLKIIEGVEECILGVAGTYPADPDQDEVWRRPT
ncbi:hypothetical protein QBC36DRAFT_290193 [Triangularia setosa]|uniref:Uncharacterized protein n=1 Tax=Triangularia setosa TaxID=2587417 RepID=A0AAN7A8X8_9PEZI|nr:hypothetical protein QBC36DRAFT_290193 [Podospora setosa]